MSKRIGEALIERGLISAKQLDRALKAQLIFGGHLGTNLIELGFTDEDSLGKTLAELLGVRYASMNMLVDIPPRVVKALPAALVEKHLAVPIDVDEKTLHLAVIDPKNLTALSSLTGRKIVPWIAPEIRIFQALEKYYDIPQRPRYISICADLDRSIEQVLQAQKAKASRRSSTGSPTPAAVGLQRAAAPRPANVASMVDLGEEYGYGRSWRDIVGEVFGDEDLPSAAARTASPPPGPHAAGRPTAPSPKQGAVSLESVSELISQANNKDQLIAAVLDFVAARADGCVLFGVKSETAQIWDWRGLGLDSKTLRSLRFPVTSGSVFTLLLGNTHYRGPVTDDPGTRVFYGSLRVDPPAEVLLLPIYLSDRLVSILYAHGKREGGIAEPTETYLRLRQKFALALKMLILKMKILSV